MHLGKECLNSASVLPYGKYVMNYSNFEAKRKISGSCLMLFFCHFCIHLSLQGWIPSVLEAKHSPAERDRTEWRMCMETVCSAQKCSLAKALGCCYSPWRKGNSGILKTGSWWEEDHRTWSNPLHEQGPPRASCHLEPLQTHFLPQFVIQLLLSRVLWLLKRVWKQEATF